MEEKTANEDAANRIELLIKSGYLRRKGNIITITEKGKAALNERDTKCQTAIDKLFDLLPWVSLILSLLALYGATRH